MVAVTLFVGFVLGALVVIGVEVLGFWYLIKKLGKKVNDEEIKAKKSGVSVNEELHLSFPNKQGWIWVLEKEKIPRTSPLTDKNLKQKRKIEVVEVSPVRKHASLKDQSLLVTEADGALTKVSLLGCIIEAVSATNLPSRKWAKKYPIKVENKSSTIYHGSKLFYIYFETSCEKESWCKALRLASCEDKEKLKWFNTLRSDFHKYLASLNVEYPSFLKPSIGFNPEIGDKTIKIDGSSSKVRQLLKKLAKKTSKTGRDEKKVGENSVGGPVKSSQMQKKPNNNQVVDEIVQALPSRSTSSGSRNQSCDNDNIEKILGDDGTLCCNLLISRLFFDAKNNVDLRSSIRERIQRTLSTIRTPSYIGEIICTGVDTGNIPPYIHGMRVLPSDLKEIVAMEIDIEYYGGAVLDIETRLEVQELENPENLDSNSENEVKTDLLEGFEHYGQQLKLGEKTNQTSEQKGNGVRKLEETKSFKGSEQGFSTLPKWKSVINSVAKQVSQVPLSLAIRVTTLRGTIRLHIKPPPSDQIWFGFTSMPDIDFSLESSVGDHKITSGHIALFIISKFKAAIRESMVLPNSESVTVPFMSAEKNDWVPQQTAPFIWTNPEPTAEPKTIPEPTHTEPKVKHEPNPPEPTQEIHKQEPQDVNTSSKRSTTESTNDSSNDEKSDENTPLLLQTEEQPPPREVAEENREVIVIPTPPPQSMAVAEENSETVEGDEGGLRRMGTRAKMLGLRKKMGEKLEEKRRNIEEKGRNIVEKMRGPPPAGGM